MSTKTGIDDRLSTEEIRKVYDLISPFYDIWSFFAERKAMHKAISLACVDNGQQILEVAIGTGIAFKAIVEKNPDGVNVGLDISRGMLKRSQKRLAKVEGRYDLTLGNAITLPYPDESFDMIFNGYMLDLIPHQEIDRILVEYKRVLKPYGKIVLITMTRGRKKISRLYEYLAQHAPRLFGGCRAIQIGSKVAFQGFKIVHQEYVEQFYFPSEITLAHKV